MIKTYICDFETDAIRDRPDYPPKPVGVAIAELTPRGKVVKARYLGWGHPTKNNATRGDALKALEEVWDSDADVCFHNAKFDLDVAATHMGLPLLPWQRVHDTLFLIYLDDPRATSLSLKPSATRILGLPPDEQEAVRDWLVANGVCRKGAKDWGAAIALAPGDVVGRYAIGDVERTGLLLHKLLPVITKRGMRAAYDRERALLPTLLANETRGVRVDLEALRADVRDYGKALLKTDAWIIKQLGASKDLNVDSDAALAGALEHAGVIESATATKTGKVSTSYKTLRLTDPRLQDALFYREKLANALRTFMVPWLSTAERSGGWIYTNWNQVRGTNDKGTRTGRFSSNPNFQNIPNEYKPFKFPVRVPPLPLVRKYILPDADDHVIVSADYCFSDDTEVLTRRGWSLFKDLHDDDIVAQWHGGKITFARPLVKQVVPYTGRMLHIRGERSTDLLVTPNHRCMLQHTDGAVAFMPADAYAIGAGMRQVHAGSSSGSLYARKSEIVITCAAQADAKYDGERLTWLLKKQRKVDRLLHSLRDTNTCFVGPTDVPSKPGFVRIAAAVVALPQAVLNLLDFDNGKTFKRNVLALDMASRRLFLHELTLWDGSLAPGKAYYSTCNIANADLVQEVCALTNMRSVMNMSILKSGKQFAIVAMRDVPSTGTDRYVVRPVDYDGVVYCVTMPESTVIVRRDGRVCVTGQSQQELRALGHFEDGPLLRAYLDNPRMDIHDHARDLINGMLGTDLSRKPIKNMGFGLVYGMGIDLLASMMGVDSDMARRIKTAYLTIFPGLRSLSEDLARRAKLGLPIKTWGGREYYCEEPKMVDGRMRTYEYKLLNVLIQGSSADCTKEAMVRYAVAAKHGRFMLQVHDQLMISVPRKHAAAEARLLRDAMESVEFDVKMLVDLSVGDSWDKLNPMEA